MPLFIYLPIADESSHTWVPISTKQWHYLMYQIRLRRVYFHTGMFLITYDQDCDLVHRVNFETDIDIIDDITLDFHQYPPEDFAWFYGHEATSNLYQWLADSQ